MTMLQSIEIIPAGMMILSTSVLAMFLQLLAARTIGSQLATHMILIQSCIILHLRRVSAPTVQ